MKYISIIYLALFALLVELPGQGYGENRDYIRTINEIPELGNNPGTTIKVSPGPRTEIPSAPPTLSTPPADITPEPSERRDIIWVHGLGGSEASLSTAGIATANGALGFPARNVLNHFVSYDETGDLNSGQISLRNDIQSSVVFTEPDTRDFIISHSQGGIVSRAMIANDFCHNPTSGDLYYKGLVTMASALNGAQIANNLETNMMQNILEKTTRIFTIPLVDMSNKQSILAIIGEISDVVDMSAASNAVIKFRNDNGIWVHNYLVKILTSPNLHDEVEDKVQEELEKSAFSDLGGALLKNILFDYKVGSSSLQNNNNCIPSEINMVAFYGNEPYEALPDVNMKNPILYRTIQPFIKEPNDLPAFTADNDSEIAMIAENVQSEFWKAHEFYAAEEIYWENYVSCSFAQYVQTPILCTVGIHRRSRARRMKTAHRLAAEWFENINDDWLGVIGAVGSNATNVSNYSGFCDCLYDEDIEPSLVDVLQEISSQQECLDLENSSQYAFFHDCKWRYSPSFTVTFDLFEKASDGVVLQESAKHLTGAQWFPRELPNSSHVQMRNNSAMKQALLDLFDGNFGAAFFETDKL